MQRWINAQKRRYYQVQLVEDLFGHWSLVPWWGGLGSHRGGVRVNGVASYAAGLAQIEAIGKPRRSRGYRNADAEDESYSN